MENTEKKYVLLSLKHSDGDRPAFWCADNCGYTFGPWDIGVYTESQIAADPDYYNDGYGAIPIEFKKQHLNDIGFRCSFSMEELKEYCKGSSFTKELS